MTAPADLSAMIAGLKAHSGGSAAVENGCLRVVPEKLLELAAYLKEAPEPGFDYLDMLTAVDYSGCFELVYRVLNLTQNRLLVIKVSLEKDRPEAPSLIGYWPGIDLQERELFDLFGISFSRHPNLKRIFLWEGFQGYPLRKDFVRGH